MNEVVWVQFLSSGNIHRRDIPDREFADYPTSTRILSRLSAFPVDSLNEETLELVRVYLDSEEFRLELATKTSSTLFTGLHSWLQAACSYYDVNKNVLDTKVD